MIDKRQLRIGNMLSANSIPVTIKEIGEFEASIEGDEGLYTYDQFDGMEMTPEILEACGFETISPQSWYLPWESYELQYSTADKELGILTPHGCTSGHTVYFPCGHLHLLQNIFFFFAGADLPVNLEKVKV